MICNCALPALTGNTKCCDQCSTRIIHDNLIQTSPNTTLPYVNDNIKTFINEPKTYVCLPLNDFIKLNKEITDILKDEFALYSKANERIHELFWKLLEEQNKGENNV